MNYPFELSVTDLTDSLDEMVDVTFESLQSQFLVLPKGASFVTYPRFNAAYETLKSNTEGFSKWEASTLWKALKEDFLSLVVIRNVLGISPPEWADLAKELGSDITQGAARTFDGKAKNEKDYLARIESNGTATVSLARLQSLVKSAEIHVSAGAKEVSVDAVHRLDKADTKEGLTSLRHAANNDIPYSVILYERFLGRPFASHRDSVSELVGDVMENAIEQRLIEANISHRRTKRAERIPGFDQAPDFFAPSEYDTKAIIEAKITGDDGTARDKVARILRLSQMSKDRQSRGEPGFEVIACIDGRGFGVRRQDMKDMLLATDGKVFTLSTLDRLIDSTCLQNLAPSGS